MLRPLRLLILFLTPLGFWGLALLVPEMLMPENLKLLAAIFALPWVLIFPLFEKLSLLPSLSGLSLAERERVTRKVRNVRGRIWQIGAIALASACILVLLSIQTAIVSSTWIAISCGVLVGICLSHLAVVPFWYAEISDFVDDIALREEEQRRRQRDVDRLSDRKST